MFIDQAKVYVKAGKGGNGAISFRREIYIPKGGPDGGDGGRGGSVIFKADNNADTLEDFRYNPKLIAEDGRPGSGTRSSGRSGADLIVKVPLGTSVLRDGKLIADLVKNGETAVIAKGGSGGYGNAHFKSSTRQTPTIAELGEPGEEFEATLELKLIADVGLVGLPNAGKSTFLSVVSSARPKIANYPFTTLVPMLGVAKVDDHELLIADIPGLIEGASEGKGLGHDFLRHVSRTAVILHLIDVYNDDAGQAYKTIRTELKKYGDLAKKPEIIALTKCEGLSEDILALQIKSIKKHARNARIFTISSPAHQGITELLRELYTTVRDVRVLPPEDSHDARVVSPEGSQKSPRNAIDARVTPSERLPKSARNEVRTRCWEGDGGRTRASISFSGDGGRTRTPESALPTISLKPAKKHHRERYSLYPDEDE